MHYYEKPMVEIIDLTPAEKMMGDLELTSSLDDVGNNDLFE